MGKCICLENKKKENNLKGCKSCLENFTYGVTLTKTSKIVLDGIQIILCSHHTELSGADLHGQTNKSCCFI